MCWHICLKLVLAYPSLLVWNLCENQKDKHTSKLAQAHIISKKKQYVNDQPRNIFYIQSAWKYVIMTTIYP